MRVSVRGRDCVFLAIASTGRTATSYIAEALNRVPGIAALHEGHLGNDAGPDVLPLVNLDNFQCFKDSERARSVVAAKRSHEVIDSARRELGVGLLVDVAYYNSMILGEMLEQMPDVHGAVIVRDCESFVRSATWFSGTDPMPVGWPDPNKELDSRERFIAMGRIRPVAGDDAQQWPAWGAVERNIWLWHATNVILCGVLSRFPGRVHFVDFENFVSKPASVLEHLLATIGHPLDAAQKSVLAGALVEARSRQNERVGGYQVGPSQTWSPDQRRLLGEAQRDIDGRLERVLGGR